MLFKLPELEQLPRFHSEVQRLALSVARAKPERRKGPSYGKIGPFDPGRHAVESHSAARHLCVTEPVRAASPHTVLRPGSDIQGLFGVVH